MSAYQIKNGGKNIMTISKFKQLTEQLPPDTIILIDSTTTNAVIDVETISIEYHTDGRSHLILSNKE
jgi:hypothetical protein